MKKDLKHQHFIDELANLDDEALFEKLNDNEEKLTPQLLDEIATLALDEDSSGANLYRDLIDKITDFIYISELGVLINRLHETLNTAEQRNILVESIDLIVPDAIDYLNELNESLLAEPDDDWLSSKDCQKIIKLIEPLVEMSEVLNQIDEALDNDDELAAKEVVNGADSKLFHDYIQLWIEHAQLRKDEEQLEYFQSLLTFID